MFKLCGMHRRVASHIYKAEAEAEAAAANQSVQATDTVSNHCYDGKQNKDR